MKSFTKHFNSTIDLNMIDNEKTNHLIEFSLLYSDLIDDNIYDLKIYWAARHMVANNCKFNKI